jgi:hypothetical protein
MENRSVANTNEGTEQRREAGISVNDSTVLHVAALANSYGFVVTAQYSIEPDTHIRLEVDSTDHVGDWRDPVLTASGAGTQCLRNRTKSHGTVATEKKTEPKHAHIGPSLAHSRVRIYFPNRTAGVNPHAEPLGKQAEAHDYGRKLDEFLSK